MDPFHSFEGQTDTPRAAQLGLLYGVTLTGEHYRGQTRWPDWTGLIQYGVMSFVFMVITASALIILLPGNYKQAMHEFVYISNAVNKKYNIKEISRQRKTGGSKSCIKMLSNWTQSQCDQ